MPREKFHVVPHDRGWAVKRESADRASSVHTVKTDAVDDARERAKSAPLGQIIIHGKDGKIQTEYTYGKDPYPPKG